MPLRRPALPRAPAGYWPAPGWDSTYDWQGFVEFSEMPWALDPKDGVIVAANQAVTSSSTPFLTSEWDDGWRSTRIGERLAAKDKVSPADMADIQLDTEDSFAKVLVPALLAVPLSASEADPDSAELLEFTREARELLRDWDFTTPAGDAESGAAAAYYNAVWRNLLELLFDDELPTGLKADGDARWRSAVQRLLTNPKSAWWDNKLTPNVTEGKDEVLRQALVEARLELTRELGKDPAKWQWGKLHRLTLEHPVLGGDTVPGPVRWLVNEGPHDMPGGSSIVNANGWNASEGYEVDWAPSMRMVVDLSDLDALDVDQPDRGERSPDRRPLRRPGRGLGGRPSATVAVHRGRRAGDRPRRAHPAAGGRRLHGLSPRSVTPSAVTTASTGWSWACRGRSGSPSSSSSPGCSTTTTGVPGRRRGRARS